MRALVPVGLSALLLLAAPASASADVIFDPADADDLSATLAEATAAQGICYGWNVQVEDPIAGRGESVGSDVGVGTPINTSTCAGYVRLDVFITYTSESSEAEDSAAWDVVSSPGGPGRSDMDSLELDWDGLTGEDPDVVIGNAVAALPLLAADKGMGEAIEAAPETGAAPADAAPTNSPGSDWWRNNAGVLLWGLGLLLAGGVFAWWVWRTNRRTRPKPMPYVIPDTVPDDLVPPPYEPPTAPIAVQKPEPATEPEPPAEAESPAEPEPPAEPESAAEPEQAAEPEPLAEPEPPVEPEPAAPSEEPAEPAARPAESTTDHTAPSEEDVAPSDRKNKE